MEPQASKVLLVILEPLDNLEHKVIKEEMEQMGSPDQTANQELQVK